MPAADCEVVMQALRIISIAVLLTVFATLVACGSAGAELPPGLQQINATALPGEPTAVPRYAVAAGYDGPLFDTHLHFDNDGFADRVAPLMRTHGVSTSVFFASASAGQLKDDIEEIEEALRDYPGMFVPFFHANPKSTDDLNADHLQRVVDSTDVQFKGFGETALYQPPWLSSRFDGPEFQGMYEFAVRNDLVVMMHPRDMQMSEVRNVLTRHPGLKLLLHGVARDILTDLPGMLAEFPNLYFTLDTSTLTITDLRIDEFGVPLFSDPLMFSPRGKDGLMETLPPQSQQVAEKQMELWLPLIEAAPDKVMWGTDVALDWHADRDTYSVLIDFSRRFINLLPEDLRDAYAFGNAERLFGSGS
jgi:predicted TIM-barrel fold metal-dependent hydrolase